MKFFTDRKNKSCSINSKFLPVMAGAFLLLASPAYAQHSPSAGSGGHPGSGSQGSAQMTEQKAEIQQKLMEMKNLQKKQQEIQQEVLSNNPELKKQEEELRELIQETLDNNLATHDIDVENLKDLQAKLQEGDLEEEKKSKLEAEFTTKVQKYKEARDETLNNPEIVEKRETLVEGIEEESSRAAKTGEKLEELEQEIRQSFNQTKQQ